MSKSDFEQIVAHCQEISEPPLYDHQMGIYKWATETTARIHLPSPKSELNTPRAYECPVYVKPIYRPAEEFQSRSRFTEVEPNKERTFKPFRHRGLQPHRRRNKP